MPPPTLYTAEEVQGMWLHEVWDYLRQKYPGLPEEELREQLRRHPRLTIYQNL